MSPEDAKPATMTPDKMAPAQSVDFSTTSMPLNTPGSKVKNRMAPGFVGQALNDMSPEDAKPATMTPDKMAPDQSVDFSTTSMPLKTP